MPKKTPQEIAEEARKKAEEQAKKKTEEQKKLFETNDLIKELNNLFISEDVKIATKVKSNNEQQQGLVIRSGALIESFNTALEKMDEEAKKRIVQSVNPLEGREFFTYTASYVNGNKIHEENIRIGKNSIGQVLGGIQKFVFYNPEHNMLEIRDAQFDATKFKTPDEQLAAFNNEMLQKLTTHSDEISNTIQWLRYNTWGDVYWYGDVYTGPQPPTFDHDMTVAYQTNAIKYESLIRADQSAILQKMANDYRQSVTAAFDKLKSENKNIIDELELHKNKLKEAHDIFISSAEKYKDFTGKVLQKVGVLPEDYDVKNKKQDEFFNDVDVSVVKYNFNQTAKGAQLDNLEQSISELSDAQSLLSQQLGNEQKQHNELKKLFKDKEQKITNLEKTIMSDKDTIANLNQMLSLEQMEKHKKLEEKDAQISNLNKSLAENEKNLKELSLSVNMSKMDLLNQTLSNILPQDVSTLSIPRRPMRNIFQNVSDMCFREKSIMSLKDAKTPEERKELWENINRINRKTQKTNENIGVDNSNYMDELFTYSMKLAGGQAINKAMLDISQEDGDSAKISALRKNDSIYTSKRKELGTYFKKIGLEKFNIRKHGFNYDNTILQANTTQVDLNKSYQRPEEKRKLALEALQPSSNTTQVDLNKSYLRPEEKRKLALDALQPSSNTTQVDLNKSYLRPEEKRKLALDALQPSSNTTQVDLNKSYLRPEEKRKLALDALQPSSNTTQVDLNKSYLRPEEKRKLALDALQPSSNTTQVDLNKSYLRPEEKRKLALDALQPSSNTTQVDLNKSYLRPEEKRKLALEALQPSSNTTQVDLNKSYLRPEEKRKLALDALQPSSNTTQVDLNKSYLRPEEKRKLALEALQPSSNTTQVDLNKSYLRPEEKRKLALDALQQSSNTTMVVTQSYLQPKEKVLQTAKPSNDNAFSIDREYEAGKAETGAGKKIIVKKEKAKMPGDRLGITNIVLGSSFLSGARALLLPNGSLFKMKN